MTKLFPVVLLLFGALLILIPLALYGNMAMGLGVAFPLGFLMGALVAKVLLGQRLPELK